MEKFKYKASNNQGQIIEGVYEASSIEDVREMIRQKQFYPLEIKQQYESIVNKEIVIFKKFSAKVLYIFCEQFGAILRSGVPMTKGLGMMCEQSDNKQLQKVLVDVNSKIQSGSSMSDAFKQHEDRFPGIFISMIQAGEASGTLDTSFARMGLMFKKDNTQKTKVRNAMIYPICIMIVCVVVVWYLLSNVVPTFENMFTSYGEDLPAVTKALISVSDFVQTNTGLLLAIFAVAGILIRFYVRSENGRLQTDRFKLNIPMVGKLYSKILAAKFTRTLSTLFSAGVSLTDSLDITSRSMSNKYCEDQLSSATSKIKQGVPLSDSIEDSKLFPIMVSQMIKVGEESGTLDELLTKVSEYYEEESDAAITRLMGMMEPAIIVVLGGIVMFVVMAILVPMFSMGDIM